MDTQRIIALIIFSFTSLLLWEAWQKHVSPPVLALTPLVSQVASPAAVSSGATPAGATVPGGSASVPSPSTSLAVTGDKALDAATGAAVNAAGAPAASTQQIIAKSDILEIAFDSTGGDIRQVVLLKHFARGDAAKPFILMQEKVGHYFIVQTGLLGAGLPNHTSRWTPVASNFELGSKDKIDVTFTNTETPGVVVDKVYTLTRGSYVVDVRYDIKNATDAVIQPKAYFQFLRDANPPEGESTGNNPFTGIATFTGPAIYTEVKKFQKVSFSDIEKNKAEHVKEASDGWLAMVQHYFVSAWLPVEGAGAREFFTKRVTDQLFSAGVITPVPAAAVNGSSTISMPLYLGPQEQDKLNKLRPGLGLVVDYGWLTFLAYPMFVVLLFINNIVGNWGWTIIIFTILLKLVFFPLNQKSGKSMAHMKTLMPKMEALKARFGDDKMKLNQGMMELYKTEKVNPLGGCLPIIIQIPFFISLYWVLLAAVELRNAPWLGWISDLSTPDPFYILPVIMGASMIIQTRLNPQPTDPIQAKVMMILPFVFSIMFFFFPSGLVLYWTMQNILGIGQQWYINKTFMPTPVKLTTPKR